MLVGDQQSSDRGVDGAASSAGAHAFRDALRRAGALGRLTHVRGDHLFPLRYPQGFVDWQDEHTNLADQQ